jgi:hypothetical protein
MYTLYAPCGPKIDIINIIIIIVNILKPYQGIKVQKKLGFYNETKGPMVCYTPYS